jgi:hypothetical protein
MLRRFLARCAPFLFAANKRRFFQLSADLTTLRWAWNKYVLLFYVEAVVPRDEELSITLVLTMEADLVLGFTVGGGGGEMCRGGGAGQCCCWCWLHRGASGAGLCGWQQQCCCLEACWG